MTKKNDPAQPPAAFAHPGHAGPATAQQFSPSAAFGQDLADQTQHLARVCGNDQMFRTICDSTYDWEYWQAPDGKYLWVSPVCAEISGYAPEDFMARPGLMRELVHPEDRPTWDSHLAQVTYRQNESCNLDFRIINHAGKTLWVNHACRPMFAKDGSPLGRHGYNRDITDRKQMELQLRHLAMHDPLTGLANRSLCLDRIRQAMARARRRRPRCFSLVFLDLDRFKVLNDSLGHGFGDKVLIAVADVLRKSTRELDTVSRFGGDEFVILLEELTSTRMAIQASLRIRQALARPLAVDGQDLVITASMGLTLDMQETDTPEDLLRNADVAMHQAKKAGRNRFKVFTKGLLERANRRLSMETDLRRAVAQEQFFVVYQPIVWLNGRTSLHGFEALVRWRHPQRGVVAPAEFIPVAEETGLIVDVGLMVLRETCKTLMDWRMFSDRAKALVMSVNLSPRQFSEAMLVDDIRAVLTETGLPPEALKLEITESAIMENAGSAVEKLKKLKALGCTLSIDDFGTGYSSMSSLQQFPLDNLKIDISFMRRLDTSQEGLEIVKAIISLAHSLRLQVVAEGVERSEQQRLLTTLRCECAQGYLYAEPLRAARVRELLQDGAGDDFPLRGGNADA